jgi:hypothetical protein
MRRGGTDMTPPGSCLALALILASVFSGVEAMPIHVRSTPAAIGGAAQRRTRAVIGGARANPATPISAKAPGVFGPRGRRSAVAPKAR